jgi:hypothetical protein
MLLSMRTRSAGGVERAGDVIGVGGQGAREGKNKKGSKAKEQRTKTIPLNEGE